MTRPYNGPIDPVNPNTIDGFDASINIPNMPLGSTCPPPKVCNRCGYCTHYLSVGYSGGFTVTSTISNALSWYPDTDADDAIASLCLDYQRDGVLPESCDGDLEITFGAPLYGLSSCDDLASATSVLDKYGDSVSLGTPIIYEIEKKDGTTESGEGCGPSLSSVSTRTQCNALAADESYIYKVEWVEI